MSEYMSDSMMFFSLGLPVGVVIGYALAQVEPFFRHHRRHR